MKKVFIVGGDNLIERMFNKRDYALVEDAKDADILCFTGGADVCPDFYGADTHHTTRFNLNRDLSEKMIFDAWPNHNKVGICRGSQFLNVMSGGTLWQDVDQHAIGGTHELLYLPTSKFQYDWKDNLAEDDEDRYTLYVHPKELGKPERVNVTSTHHQMMRPHKESSELWGFTWLSKYRDHGDQNKRRVNFDYSPDVEIVYYPGTKSLCFQPHPEYGVKSCEDLFFTCLNRAFA